MQIRQAVFTQLLDQELATMTTYYTSSHEHTRAVIAQQLRHHARACIRHA